MRETRQIMGMPVTIEVVDARVTGADLAVGFDYFTAVDARFSTYKPDSEISQINRGLIDATDYSYDMRTIMTLAEETKAKTDGYFDCGPIGSCDPSGIVKGWAIHEVAKLLAANGWRNFYVDAGGDVQVAGHNAEGNSWQLGIRNPFDSREVVKVIALTNAGIATSGTYERGTHIYNPKTGQPVTDIISLTVVGLNIYEADRYATAAFAMGKDGILFLEGLLDIEAYMIDTHGQATATTHFEDFTTENHVLHR